MLNHLIFEQNLLRFSINIVCLVLMFISVQIAITKKVLFNIIYLCVFSLFLCVLYLLLDAPDVSMTESSLGAALTTVIFLNVSKKISIDHKDFVLTKSLNTSSISDYSMIHSRLDMKALIVCTIIFIILVLGFTEMGDFGEKDSNLLRGVSDYYTKNTKQEIGIDSFVASILASYRGFDTLCETCVIFLACISVLLVLARGNNNAKK